MRTRRHFFRDCGVGVGKIALATLLAESQARTAWAGRARLGRPRATSWHPGRPTSPRRRSASSSCSWPARPASSTCSTTSRPCASYDGQPIPAEVVKDQRYAFIRPDASLMSAAVRVRPARPVRRRALGDAAAPGEGRRRDRDRQVDAHRPVQPRPGADLPQHRLAAARPAEHGLVGLLRAGQRVDATCPASSCCPSGSGISGGAANWSSGFLPTSYQGVPFRTKGDPILDVASPPGVDRRLQRDSLDLIGELNRQHLGDVGDPEIATRISSYEMAFRMQTAAPELMDLSGETPGDAGAVRRRAGQAVVRQQLPAGPPAGRARRAVRQPLSRGLGPPLGRRRGPARRSAARPTAPPRRWCST